MTSFDYNYQNALRVSTFHVPHQSRRINSLPQSILKVVVNNATIYENVKMGSEKEWRGIFYLDIHPTEVQVDRATAVRVGLT